MTLAELITYRYKISMLDCPMIKDAVNEVLTEINTIVGSADVDQSHTLSTLELSKHTISNELSQMHHNLAVLRSKIDALIDSQKPQYFKRSQDIYNDTVIDDPQIVLDRQTFDKLLSDEEVNEVFYSRVRLHSNWKYPGLEIRPALGHITEIMKDCDPLYLVDLDHRFFQGVKDLWTPQYQRRLRYYTVDETDSEILVDLPIGQFGCIVAVDFFNRRPMSLIEKWLREFYTKLRPGGTVIFTYNNCDLPAGALAFEKNSGCYTPESDLTRLCAQIGFKVHQSFNLNKNISWLEIQRPGELATIRGGQSLAMIKEILSSPAMPKDPDPMPPPTELELVTARAKELGIAISADMSVSALKDQILIEEKKKELDYYRSLAVKLKIDSPSNIRYGYSLETLKKLVKKWRNKK